MAIGSTLMGVLLFALAMAAAVLLLIFVMVPLLKGLGWLIGAAFKGIGWLFMHVFEFIAGMIGDTLRFVGSIIAMIVLMPLTVLNVLIGRWSAAGHFADSVKREFKVAGACLYRVALRRPLKLVLLHGLLEGVEQRVPEAMAAAPTSDRPGRRIGQFAGYKIVGSLPGGGSGAKLYIAEPDDAVRRRYPGMPERVVIKSFAITEGSSLPQIVRESRALECAKQLGLVFEHGMDEHRFYYVMPYHAGDHLGIITRQLHGETGGSGLKGRHLTTALSYMCNLVETLTVYHAGGLWHKDVKPENIIIHDGRAHLVDLGLVTPLRSAMTLTTHGTEYFRDPEMVRLALRGVKVHQVNGAKFDIFAAGAVIYFMIENTFPPHGALSRFSRKSPEALKWIVRRAMADYTHRYERPEDMLDDLHHVASARDPFAVKPADLPSMRGGAAESFVIDDEPAEAARVAGSPGPPSPPREEEEVKAWGVYAGPGGIKVGRLHGGARAPAAASARSAQGRAPGLKVTNWWTGEYQVEDPGTSGQAVAAAAAAVAPDAVRAARAQAAGFRQDAESLRGQVRAGTKSARRAAQERIRAARARAKDMRQRIKTKRHSRAVAERQPSFTLLAISLAVLVLIVSAVGMFTLRSARMRPPHVVAIAPPAYETTISIRPDSVMTEVRKSQGRPILIVPSLDNPYDPSVSEQIDKIADRHRETGYDVIINHDLADTRFRTLLEQWRKTQDSDDDEALEDAMEELNLYGLVHVSHRDPDRSGSRVRLNDTLVWSTREGADDRVFYETPAPGEGVPLLLVNDHPTRTDPAVERRVVQLIKQFEAQGWTVIVDAETEAAVRMAMPAVPGELETEVPQVLRTALRKHELGGLLYVYARPGDEPARDRMGVTLLDLPPAEAGEEFETSETEDIDSSAGSFLYESDGDAAHSQPGRAA